MRGRRVKTLLFDLDGTLIKLDMAVFLPGYFHALGKHVAHLTDAQVLTKQILESTEAMVNNLDPKLTNQEVFEQDFTIRSGLAAEEVLPLFDSFYRDVFPHLAGEEVRSSSAREAVGIALEQGLEVVVATNPVFPLRAIRERLRWGGFEDTRFTLITGYENMHFCKPGVEYYEEILRMLARRPEECWMIGNDVGEDMIAGELGISTFLVQDYFIPGPEQLSATRTGYMADLPGFVKSVAGYKEGIPFGSVE